MFERVENLTREDSMRFGTATSALSSAGALEDVASELMFASESNEKRQKLSAFTSRE